MTPPPLSSGLRATKLITALPREGPHQEALVGGPLGVDAAGCVTVGGDEYVLVAPPDSKLVADGTAIEMPGYGVIALGAVPENWRGCSGRYFVEVARRQ